jgi:UDP-N-acetylmuramate dehydrogenase
MNNAYLTFKKQLIQASWKIDPLFSQPLSTKTSVKVGGPALFFVVVSSFIELIGLMKLINQHNIPWFVIGKGSNLLIKDDGFPGVVIQLKGEFSKIEQIGDRIVSGAGASNSRLSRFARKQSLSGTEFLSGIPGSIGGAIYMNAGAYGFEIKNIVQWVEFIDQNGKIHNLPNSRLHFSYRQTRFTNLSGIILKVCLQLKLSDSFLVKETEDRLLAKRKKSQPLKKHTWGSVFVNPPGQKVARLIESCDLKGKGVGGAKISTKHANFIENTGGASFRDLMATVNLARSAVLKKYGIKLKMEGRIVPE